jgi:hypothetical protein
MQNRLGERAICAAIQVSQLRRLEQKKVVTGNGGVAFREAIQSARTRWATERDGGRDQDGGSDPLIRVIIREYPGTLMTKFWLEYLWGQRQHQCHWQVRIRC